MDNDRILNFFGFLLISICWGATNPFLKKAMVGIDQIKIEHPGFLTTKFYEFLFLLKPGFIIPLFINLSGSTVFYYMLSNLDLTLVVPVVNGMSLLSTSLIGWILGERLTSNEWLGVGILTIGIFISIL